MAAVADLVHQTSSTTGTGNKTLSSVNGKQTFSGAFGTGGTNVFFYFISNQGAAEYEYGTGHMFDATTLVSDTVLGGSNGTSAVNFSAGTKDVTNDIPASLQTPLIAANGSAIALQSSLDALSLTTSVLALQVADLTNVALFPDPNNVFDSFDALTYVDTAGATNLDTSAAGLLKPTSGIDTYTKLALHFDGSDAATTTSDSSASGHAITFSGNAQLDTAQQKFGASSLLLDGTGDYVSTGSSADFNMQATGDWTVECWVRANSLPASSSTVFHFDNTGGTANQGLHIHISSAGALQTDNGITASGLSAGTISTGVWTHIAVTRESGTTKLWVGGSLVDSEAAQDYGDLSGVCQIGRYGSGGTTNDFNGWIDEIRISKGVARYTSNFTPASAAFGTNNLTVQSTSFTASSAPSTMKAVIRVKEVDAAAAGTDYTLEVSRDGGTTWTTATLTELFTSPSPTASIRVCQTNAVDVSGQPSGTSPRWRFKTLNNKMVELHDASLYWG